MAEPVVDHDPVPVVVLFLLAGGVLRDPQHLHRGRRVDHTLGAVNLGGEVHRRQGSRADQSPPGYGPSMDSALYLTHLRRDLAAFEECLDGELSAPVEHCGDWTLRDLADHLGRGNLWAAMAITEGRGDYEAPAGPTAQADLLVWFRQTSDVLLDALGRDPATPAWTFFPPRTVAFWHRRRALETLVHRWDAENAIGLKSSLDPMLADDGVAEVFHDMAPRQIRLGRHSAPEHAVQVSAADTGSSWVWGPGEPVATITATSAELLLMLWGRMSSADDVFTWQGDRDIAQTLLDDRLVP